jgi:CspA family cold shock protein
MIAKVRWFSKRRGYGFGIDSEGSEYFLHYKNIQGDSDFKYLEEGQAIEFDIQPSMDGKLPKAINIRTTKCLNDREVGNEINASR